MFILVRLGIVTPQWLAARRRFAILIIAIVAALATPGGDPFSMIVLALFMYGLFEGTLVVLRAIRPREAKPPADVGE
jgi:sec-independent protein translocase protein TatC